MKKGITLVQLIITIIVMVILTGAVVINAMNVPNNANLTVFKTNIGTVQDAVTLKMLNNLTSHAESTQEWNDNAKWIGVISGYTQENIANAPKFERKINGVNVAALDITLKEQLEIESEEFAKYYVAEDGTVYHTGYEVEGVVYYNAITSNIELRSIEITSQPTKTLYTKYDEVDIDGLVVIATYSDKSTKDITNICTFNPALTQVTKNVGDAIDIQVSYEGKIANEYITIKVKNWYETASSNINLNNTTPYVQEIIDGITYYAPIPLGFTVSTNTNEDQISEGLVIVDNQNNQFVWIPVNDTLYNITSALNKTVTEKTALAYWEDNVNGTGAEGSGFNEPYPRSGWTKLEWDNMYISVMRYEGFYIGRYETGYEMKDGIKKPVVKSGVNVWKAVEWNDTNIMDVEPANETATYISRDMYKNTDEYGVVSTLIYGIQWDSVMNWAKCGNNMRDKNTYTATPSLTGAAYSTETIYDMNNNIYDLAGNVREWTMEALDSTGRVFRGGYYSDKKAISYRHNSILLPTYQQQGMGFRISLYVK